MIVIMQPITDCLRRSINLPTVKLLGFAIARDVVTRYKRPRPCGFTLVELMIVLALIAILTFLAAPSFGRLIQATKIGSGVNAFLSDMRFARSEAIRRGGGVVICRSDVPEAINPVCAIDTGSGGNGWASGWIVFYNLDSSGAKSTDDPLLRVQSPLSSINGINDSNLFSTKFRFTATGRLVNANSATSLVFGTSPLFASDVQRTVCVGLGGSARIAGDGAATCGRSVP